MHEINNEVSSLLRGLIEKRMQAMKEGAREPRQRRRLAGSASRVEHERDGRAWPVHPGDDNRRRHRGVQALLLRRHGDHVCAANLGNGPAMHAPGVAGPCERGGLWPVREKQAGIRWLSRLKTLTMILHEVLRLYPPAITISRKTYKEMETGGVRYPAGVVVELPVLLIHHDPDLWGSDAHEFRPDRFAEGVSKAPAAFFPFGWGPRTCIGQNFALLEAKMALSMILQWFEFELAPSYTHEPRTVITLHPMHGAQIKLKAL
ncbi:hypothetical protein SORBI_3001G385132 [Sorghum bicolor]|uniref:Cytochrome P450 n=1 Tax=Sorghum bicolor TaxID=4558 RepID=A0A1Z5S9P4_SORBI|nr:hypothetical protein SORBI_3001G385132 [Sorghum bicolor]